MVHFIQQNRATNELVNNTLQIVWEVIKAKKKKKFVTTQYSAPH
jgi:hypothetical protein